MSYEVDIRGKGATEWEVCDLHRSPSIISPLPASLTLFCKAWSGKEKKKKKRVRAFCVNSLIRKTLTSIVPLHFGGKIFHWFFFAAIEGGQSWEGLCVGLHSAGGFQGRVGRRRGVSVCVRACGGGWWGNVPPHNPYPFSPSERTNYSCDPRAIITHLFLPPPVVSPRTCLSTAAGCLFFQSHMLMINPAHLQNIWIWQAFCFVFSRAQEWWRMPMFFSKSTKIKCLSNVLFVIPQSNGTNIYISLVSFWALTEKKRKRPQHANCHFPSGAYGNHSFQSLSPSLSSSCHSRLSLNYAFTPAGAGVSLKWLFLPHRRLLLVIICIIIKFDELLRDRKSHLTQVPDLHLLYTKRKNVLCC